MSGQSSTLNITDYIDPADTPVFDRELDFRSVRDGDTGAVFSLGDPLIYFEAVLGVGERLNLEQGNAYSNETNNRYSFRFENYPESLYVTFIDDRAVAFSTTDVERFEFAYLSAGIPLPPERFGGVIAPFHAGNSQFAFMFFDSLGNTIAVRADRDYHSEANGFTPSPDWMTTWSDVEANRELATYELARYSFFGGGIVRISLIRLDV